MSEPIHGRSVTVRGMIVRASGCETILCRGSATPRSQPAVKSFQNKKFALQRFVHREIRPRTRDEPCICKRGDPLSSFRN
jgi:hypothetical protein